MLSVSFYCLQTVLYFWLISMQDHIDHNSLIQIVVVCSICNEWKCESGKSILFVSLIFFCFPFVWFLVVDVFKSDLHKEPIKCLNPRLCLHIYFHKMYSLYCINDFLVLSKNSNHVLWVCWVFFSGQLVVLRLSCFWTKLWMNYFRNEKCPESRLENRRVNINCQGAVKLAASQSH